MVCFVPLQGVLLDDPGGFLVQVCLETEGAGD